MTLPDELRAEVAAELNVLHVDGLGGEGDDLVHFTVKPNFRSLGKRFAKRTPTVAAAVSAADPQQLVADLRAGTARVDVDGEPVELETDDVLVTETPRQGWSVATEHGVTVALDLELTPELRRAGQVRESIRAIQESRKAAGFEVSDRITLAWRTESEELAQALRDARDTMAGDVLAESVREQTTGDADAQEFHEESLGLTYWLRRV